MNEPQPHTSACMNLNSIMHESQNNLHRMILFFVSNFYLFNFMEIYLMYNITLVSGMQHSDSTVIYITKCSP